jgi:phosphate:Na+ symporter
MTRAAGVASAIFLNGDAAISSHAGDADKLRLAVEEGGLFLRIVSDLRRVHSHLVTFAYPIFNRISQTPSTAAVLDLEALDANS